MGSAQDALSNVQKDQRVSLDGLEGIKPDLLLRAKLICSHFLLPDNATILDVGSEDGALMAAIAHLCPRHNFIGIDRNAQSVKAATKKYQNIKNATFQKATAQELPFEDNSIDGIINSRILGDIYSQSGYYEQAVRDALKEQFRVLRPEGMIVIYDYAKAPDDEYMLMEFPTLQKPSQSFPKAGAGGFRKTQGDRDAEDLIWFSENARPKQARGCEGFFLEELSPRFPYTRLFRLPSKWAFEFLIRKEGQEDISKNIGREHAVFSDLDYYRELQSLGGRVLYSTPWQNPYILQNRFKDAFRLYHDEGTPAGYPATGKLVTIQKMQDKKSLVLHELRSTKKESELLSIQTVRDDKTGQLIDLVERAVPTVDLIPYKWTAEGRLKIYLHFAAPKCVANTVPRVGNNLDGKKWSGHLLSPLKMPIEQLEDVRNGSQADLARMMMKQTGLKPSVSGSLEKGPEGYPSPDMIAEKISTYFIEVQDGQTPKCMAKLFEDRKGFSTVGEIRELDVEDVLRAINVGFVPNGWLEIQLQGLLAQHDMNAIKWMHEALPIGTQPPEADRILRAKDILEQIEASKPDAENGGEAGDKSSADGDAVDANADIDTRFKKVKGSAGKIRTVRSLFIDEGMVDGRLSGLASSDAEFAIPEGDTINKAVIMPLTSDLKGNVLMGFEFEELPVPNRMGQSEKMINLPSITLPREIKTIDDAKAHIAQMFETTADYVVQMGEGYFTHVDVTPQRIFPFAVASHSGGGIQETYYAPVHDLWLLTKPDYSWSFLYLWGMAYMMLGQDSVFSVDFAPRFEASARQTAVNSPKHSSALSAPMASSKAASKGLSTSSAISPTAPTSSSASPSAARSVSDAGAGSAATSPINTGATTSRSASSSPFEALGAPSSHVGTQPADPSSASPSSQSSARSQSPSSSSSAAKEGAETVIPTTTSRPAESSISPVVQASSPASAPIIPPVAQNGVSVEAVKNAAANAPSHIEGSAMAAISPKGDTSQWLKPKSRKIKAPAAEAMQSEGAKDTPHRSQKKAATPSVRKENAKQVNDILGAQSEAALTGKSETHSTLSAESDVVVSPTILDKPPSYNQS